MQEIKKVFTATSGTTYYAYMAAIDGAGHITKAYNNGAAIVPGSTNLQLGNGSFDSLDGVNSPDISKLPDSSTYYVTWASNTANPTELAKTANNIPTDWYDYEAGKWANIKSGANNLEAYWVWIPRFAYVVPNSATSEQINVKFINGTGTSLADGSGNAVYVNSLAENGLYVNLADKYKKGGTNETYIVHPAFTFGNTQLSGIWVAKFEPSNPNCSDSDVSTGQVAYTDLVTAGKNKLTVKPNVTSWRTIQLANAFTVCENAVKTGGTIGNGSSNIDCHPAKNMEWGAIAILSQSEYGIFNPESTITDPDSGNRRIWNNSSKKYITGSVASAVDEYSTKDNDTHLDTTGAYNSANGAKASTTGTIYGIYDTAGGVYEYVMGFLAPQGVTTVTRTTVGSVGRETPTYYTGFYGTTAYSNETVTAENATEKGGIRALPDRKYYDVYAYGTSDKGYQNGYIGEATSEMQPSNSNRTWNGDYANFVYAGYPVCNRGGGYGNGAYAGVFYFSSVEGDASSFDSFRPVLVVV